MTDVPTSASCRCGKVKLQLTGAPILRGICYCTSCQEAGRRHRAAPGADPVVAQDGGTDYVLCRKDRVRCVKGGDLLEERRLKPDSPTRRLFAHCCNTAMFLDFTKGTGSRLSRPPSRRHPTSRHADDDRRTARGGNFAERHGQLSGPLRKIHAEIAAGVDGHGIATTGGRWRAMSVRAGRISAA